MRGELQQPETYAFCVQGVGNFKGVNCLKQGELFYIDSKLICKKKLLGYRVIEFLINLIIGTKKEVYEVLVFGVLEGWGNWCDGMGNCRGLYFWQMPYFIVIVDIPGGNPGRL